MITAKEAKEISIENCDFIEKYEIEKEIMQAALNKKREVVIFGTEKIPATVVLLLTNLGYEVNVFKIRCNNYDLSIKW